MPVMTTLQILMKSLARLRSRDPSFLGRINISSEAFAHVAVAAVSRASVCVQVRTSQPKNFTEHLGHSWD